MKKSKASSVQPRKPASSALRELARSAGDIAGKDAALILFGDLRVPGCDGCRTQHGVNDARDLRHFGYVVDANDMRASEDARGDRGRRTPGALAFRRAAERLADETLSRRADQQRKTEARELRQLLQQLEILRRALAEADAGVEHNLRFCDARAARSGHGMAQTGNDVAEHVARERLFLHRSRLPRMCISISGSLCFRATSARRGSAWRVVTSLRISAP